ncbi:MAG TPA: alpha-L-arabinofuranosidase C-terminal domain-containing protein [Bryobacteraceae bacterium]|jgi:alpha-N-arabinofuranosidase|nr:alpha-L-arabinofuranosidase C-terminal domain-containing protein [Bryobacteraceae bacterium]
MLRRDFLHTMAAAGAALLTRIPARAQQADSSIEVFPNEPLGEISPNIYGHFTEHIGGVIYDGVWVGRNSRIPNTDGIRNSLIDALKRIKAPVIRWPGGCFADSYDWKDGIGPAGKRPARTNFWEVDPDLKRLHEKGVQVFETNEFGTNEFAHFCKLVGAEPYLAANLRSLPALDFDHWVEYCNSPAGSTSYARMREAAGYTEPFHVRYWGVGNESWGCGGNFAPEDYASEFRRFTTWVPEYGQDLCFIAAGPNDNDMNWTRRFFSQIFTPPRAYHNPHFRGWSVHHYSRVSKGGALEFGPAEWYELLRSANFMEQIILDNWAIMGEYDRVHRVKLVVDEYGPWYRAGTEIDPTHLFGQQITMRDAVATALTLDCFNRHPEKVMMANCAQLINNINTLFLAHEDKFWVTPNYHVFEMYAAHQGAQAVRANFSAPRAAEGLWGLNGSASLKGKALTLTVVNSSVDAPRTSQISVNGGRITSAQGMVLHASDIHAHNTFEDQKAVVPNKISVQVQDRSFQTEFPAASVTKIELQLG